jgi:hypothetical protein
MGGTGTALQAEVEASGRRVRQREITTSGTQRCFDTPLTRHLRGSSFVSRPLSHDALWLLKAALHTVVADEQVLEGPEDVTGETTAQMGLYTHTDARTAGVYLST